MCCLLLTDGGTRIEEVANGGAPRDDNEWQTIDKSGIQDELHQDLACIGMFERNRRLYTPIKYDLPLATACR